jgi:hypothetical protein
MHPTSNADVSCVRILQFVQQHPIAQLPASISLEAISKIVCTTPAHTLFRSCKQKQKLVL